MTKIFTFDTENLKTNDIAKYYIEWFPLPINTLEMQFPFVGLYLNNFSICKGYLVKCLILLLFHLIWKPFTRYETST